MKKAIVIDGYAIIYRSFYATYNQLAYFHDHDTLPTNAIRTVMMTVLNILSTFDASYMLIALDSKEKTKRKEQYDEYKGTRSPMPDDLIRQLPYIEQFFNLLNVKVMRIPGYEADDLIGSFTTLMSKNNINSTIFSGDNDLMQLIDVNTNMSLLSSSSKGNNNLINLQNFDQYFHNLRPKQIVDFKALVGDTSDNYPGVKGIGPKTAVNLIRKYGSLDEIYLHLDELSLGVKTKLSNDKNSAYFCYGLALIETSLFNDKEPDEFIKKELDKEGIKKLADSLYINLNHQLLK
ncbi:5'-3' exonuclease [Ureaplasma canigenitalium]|uniref:5'-3' exonuclease n=1 Tax=Ureaplasma canigenitalium TaxID=42092 RepID=UPI0004E1A6C6|nr:5'-3' exonuclease H3TH domain-containing protein [Ureaplasma canigenitalium]